SLDQMDRYPEMRRHNLVIDYVPIHTIRLLDPIFVKKTDLDRAEKVMNLYPIEQFWSVVKNKVKRSQFADKQDLRTRINEACNAVPIRHLKAHI
ncbi:hypothetical protein BDB00DRAFT_772470, partial [Zychaea mexicana]|uniref:uncharacterized protein n=1 Tax=Zychaea mexicana TaxID=64656 RepID=UPI0022FE89B0